MNFNSFDDEFNLQDIENANPVERSVTVLPPPSPMSRSNQVNFFTADNFEEQNQFFFQQAAKTSSARIQELPDYYIMDSTHLRLTSKNSRILNAVNHPLDAVESAMKLLSNLNVQFTRSPKGKIKGIITQGSATSNFRVHVFTDGADTIIEFHLRNGDRFLFQRFYAQMGKLLDNTNTDKYVVNFNPNTNSNQSISLFNMSTSNTGKTECY